MLLDPSAEAQVEMVQSLWRHLLPGAHMLLLVPSLESAIHVVSETTKDTLMMEGGGGGGCYQIRFPRNHGRSWIRQQPYQRPLRGHWRVAKLNL